MTGAILFSGCSLKYNPKATLAVDPFADLTASSSIRGCYFCYYFWTLPGSLSTGERYGRASRVCKVQASRTPFC